MFRSLPLAVLKRP